MPKTVFFCDVVLLSAYHKLLSCDDVMGLYGVCICLNQKMYEEVQRRMDYLVNLSKCVRQVKSDAKGHPKS